METQPRGTVPPETAREQLRAARRAHDASVRRATAPASLILALSAFCGAMTIPVPDKGPGNVVTIVALVWFVAELLKLAARNHWRPLLSLPTARWSVAEVALLVVAVILGSAIGPHVLAHRSGSGLAGWGAGAAVAAGVATCLFAARASYRHRAARAWPR